VLHLGMAFAKCKEIWFYRRSGGFRCGEAGE
jgi:hypothetical protein